MVSINVLLTEHLHSVTIACKFCLQHNRTLLCLCRRRRDKRLAVTLACEKLGERLFEARDRAGFTLRELGERSGVSWSSISAIEKGRQSATAETVERLAIALNVRPAWLAFGEGSERIRRRTRDVRPSSADTSGTRSP
jgi:ribosome-binding protein aMBF1 (putative translation factor)